MVLPSCMGLGSYGSAPILKGVIMDFLKQMADANVGKRMAVCGWAGWLIKDATDDLSRAIIAGLAVVYMICQTFSDWKAK